MRHDCARCEDIRMPKIAARAMEVNIGVMDKKVVGIVEDDPGMLRGLQRVLSVHGFVTEAYTSAEAFLECSTGSKANCLVLDINLGGISGIDLRRRLAAAGSRLPVIFMTSGDSEIVRAEALAAGCVAFLRKPFPARQLIDAIAQAAT
jgi:FixJ family two-component response regulator